MFNIDSLSFGNNFNIMPFEFSSISFQDSMPSFDFFNIPVNSSNYSQEDYLSQSLGGCLPSGFTNFKAIPQLSPNETVFPSISTPANHFPTLNTSAPTTTTSSSVSRTRRTSSYTGSLSNYNSEKGSRIADIALRNAGFVIDPVTKKVTSRRKDPQRFTGTCARHVMTSLTDAGVDGGLPRVASAYQLADTLRRNSNFQEISASTPLKDLPPGTVIVYGRGVAGYSARHGHVEIITNDGRAVSDAITDNLYRRPSQIFIPV